MDDRSRRGEVGSTRRARMEAPLYFREWLVNVPHPREVLRMMEDDGYGQAAAEVRRSEVFRKRIVNHSCIMLRVDRAGRRLLAMMCTSRSSVNRFGHRCEEYSTLNTTVQVDQSLDFSSSRLLVYT